MIGDNLSHEFKSNVFYGVTKSIYDLSKEKIIPQLGTILSLAELSAEKKLTDKEKALIGLYYRLHGWLESFALMNTSACFQGVAAGARAVFELVLDMEILDKDKSGEELKKFNAFTGIDRADAAEKCLDYFKESKQTPSMFREEHLLGPILLNKEKMEKDRVELWNQPKHGAIKHWSGKDARARASSIKQEYENLYVEFYPLLSWSVHPGATVYGGKNFDALQSYFQVAHGFVHKLAPAAIKIISREFHLAEVIQNLNQYLNRVKDMPYEIIVNESEKLESSKNQKPG